MCAFEVGPDDATCRQCGLTLAGLQQVSLGAIKLSASPNAGAAASTTAVDALDDIIESGIRASGESSKPVAPATGPEPAKPAQDNKPARPTRPAPVADESSPPPAQQTGFLAWLRRLFKL